MILEAAIYPDIVKILQYQYVSCHDCESFFLHMNDTDNLHHILDVIVNISPEEISFVFEIESGWWSTT